MTRDFYVLGVRNLEEFWDSVGSLVEDVDEVPFYYSPKEAEEALVRLEMDANNFGITLPEGIEILHIRRTDTILEEL